MHPSSSAAGAPTPLSSVLLLAAAVALLLPGAAASSLSTALTVKVSARGQECFFEEAKRAGEKGYLHYQVTSGGQLDIDVTVTDPSGQVVYMAERKDEERVLFKTTMTGEYSFCFANLMSTLTMKTVAFDIAIGDPTAHGEVGVGGHVRSMDPIEVSIIKVTEGLNEVKQEQSYLTARERVHRATAEATNGRVLYFSMLEIFLLLVMGVGQIVYLRQQFEVKRYV